MDVVNDRFASRISHLTYEMCEDLSFFIVSDKIYYSFLDEIYKFNERIIQGFFLRFPIVISLGNRIKFFNSVADEFRHYLVSCYQIDTRTLFHDGNIQGSDEELYRCSGSTYVPMKTYGLKARLKF